MSDRPFAHHGSGGPSHDQPPVPEPTYAERARTLIHIGRVGSLSTVSRKHPGWPFGSVMPYGLDGSGRPIFLISGMAVHTQNIGSDPRASLLVTAPHGSGDPLGAARATLMGNVAPVPAVEREHARQLYLARYENAKSWVDYPDFTFCRLEVLDIYFVGGFGVMGWVSAEDYALAAPDPLADAAPGILQHMNLEHTDALLLLGRVFGSIDADEATMTLVDRLGFHMRLRRGNQVRGIRIPFSREVRTPQETRTVLVEMVSEAKRRA